jgi:hypothetical protein
MFIGYWPQIMRTFLCRRLDNQFGLITMEDSEVNERFGKFGVATAKTRERNGSKIESESNWLNEIGWTQPSALAFGT